LGNHEKAAGDGSVRLPGSGKDDIAEPHILNQWEEPYGDRRQELVFIG
jgi:hypothetical protein